MEQLLVNKAMAQRLEGTEARNNIDYVHALEKLLPGSRAQFLPIAGGYAIFHVPHSPINRATGLGFSEPVSDDHMDQVENFFRSVGMPAQVDVCPLVDHSLLARLSERGYRILHFFNVHVRALTSDDARDSTSLSIQVQPVGPAKAELWMETVARGFIGTDEVPPGNISTMFARLAYHRPGVTCFLAFVNGEAAAGAALSMRDGVATLFSTSTRPAFRRSGCQTALLQARLAVAASAGCDVVAVLTTPGSDSERNVQRHAFKIAYTKLIMIRELM
jgi:GNAT superfamily N-acetyltransferase